MAWMGDGLCLVFAIITFVQQGLSDGQMVQSNFPLSSVALVPSIVVMNSMSSVNFVCINHHSDNSPLIIRLSRNISDDRLRLSTSPLNATVTQITLQSNGYIGTFHLLCHTRDDESGETRADVIIKADAGLLQLAQRCRVYEREYIKCMIRASTIARAIRNGFIPDIDFTEITASQAYKQKYEFLTNESTDEYLVFKWRPKVDGQFPDGVLMNIKITLPFFGTTQYRFDMTPSEYVFAVRRRDLDEQHSEAFVIKPDFTVQTIAKNKILLRLTPTSPPVMCQFSIRFKSAVDANQTWLAIEADQINIVAENAFFNAEDQICVRCRQTVNDSYSGEECRVAKPSSRWRNIMKIVIVLVATILLIIIPINIYLYISRRKRSKLPAPEVLVLEDLIPEPNLEPSAPPSAQPGARTAIFQDYESSIISDVESSLSPDHTSPPFASDRYTRWRPM